MRPQDPADPFLHRAYDALGDSPMQRKIRRLCPLPVGVVYIQQSDHDESDLRRELRAIRSLGISNLKQFHFMGEVQIPLPEAERISLEEGIIPHWYGIGGWKDITPELLAELGIPANTPMAEIEKHPAMIAYQTEALKERARRRTTKGSPPEIAEVMGEARRIPAALSPDQVPAFAAWLQEQYGTLDACRAAYKLWHAEGIATWESLAEPFLLRGEGNGDSDDQPKAMGWMDFRRVRDVLRFQADRHCTGIRETSAWHLAWDPDEPVRAGCHRVFENEALSGWDFEAQAQAIKEAGSFYASFHPAHHLREVNGEVDIPCYLTARMVADFAKGGWPAMWESVGGPNQFSGTHAFYFDGDTLMRCLISYLAAGLKGVGIWSWNVRDWGWEIGEYSLCDLNGHPTDRARAAGKVARACERWRFELWEARDEPLVGILFSWENEAAFARLSMGGYVTERMKAYPTRPSEARIGVARALIGGNIPFEFVTERDLAKGLAARYRHIYVPHTLCLSPATLRALREYAEAGGHVIIDAPTLLINADNGTLFDTRKGTDYERLFGFVHAELQNTFNRPTTLDGLPLEGQTYNVDVTTARVTATFDGTERPAVLEHEVGRGRTTAFTFELSHQCFRPGNVLMENLIENYILGWDVAPWRPNTDRVLIYRRVAPQADHYFLINPDDRTHRVHVAVRDRPHGYKSGEDCISGKPVLMDGTNFSLTLPAGSARWVRLAKNG